jgi:hypothetical protein
MKKKDELKRKLRSKIQNQQNQRNPKIVKDLVVDDNLKKLGINSKDELKKYLDNINDIDKNKLATELEKYGISREQLTQFYEKF